MEHSQASSSRDYQEKEAHDDKKAVIAPPVQLVVGQLYPEPVFVECQAKAEAVEQGYKIFSSGTGEYESKIAGYAQDEDAIDIVMDVADSQIY